jgi:Cysteine-rich secretory protein family
MMFKRKILVLAAMGLVAAGSVHADSQSFESRLLSAHNAERALKSAPPLEWSPALARDAAAWATTLARSGKFEHAHGGASPPQGENLWMGTKSAFTPEEMVQSWIDEKADYKRGLFPNVSRTGDWGDVGHYTQLIWRDTKQVGCARVSSREDDYLVCRYFPAGNWMGSDPEGTRQPSTLSKPRRRN